MSMVTFTCPNEAELEGMLGLGRLRGWRQGVIGGRWECFAAGADVRVFLRGVLFGRSGNHPRDRVLLSVLVLSPTLTRELACATLSSPRLSSVLPPSRPSPSPSLLPPLRHGLSSLIPPPYSILPLSNACCARAAAMAAAVLRRKGQLDHTAPSEDVGPSAEAEAVTDADYEANMRQVGREPG